LRRRYLVAYDVSDSGRLRRTYRKMCGFGTPLQYSVFRCALSAAELVLLRSVIGEIINHAEDRVMIVDIGPVDGRADAAFEFLGRHDLPPDDLSAVIV
jgi:CRISPR-associated protein Cas2